MTVQEWVDREFKGSDSDRTSWQISTVVQWANQNYRGSAEAATGSGKSRIGIHAIRLLRREDDSRRVMIVVPTRILKTQWESELKKWKLDKNAEVWVINSAIRGFHQCDLLILDEIHRMAADTFSQVFSTTEYNFVLGLTATLKRLDGKHELLKTYAPICSSLSMAQARAKGWVANYREYWLGLELNEEDREHYDHLQAQYQKFFRVYQMDFDSVKRGLGDASYRNAIAARLDLEPDYVYIAAVNTMRYIRLIRKWLIGHDAKIRAAERLITELNRKTLTFGDSIEVADVLSERLGSKAMAFHSDMQPIEKDSFRDKTFKTEAGARRNAERLSGEYKLKHGRHVVQHKIVKKISGKKLKEYVLHKIANTSQLMAVCTARALNEGFDFPGAELGVTLSRSSSPTTYVQQTGRVVRLSEGSVPIMIHVYLKNTKDEKWLYKAGHGAVGALRMHTVDELLDHVKSKENDNGRIS